MVEQGCLHFPMPQILAGNVHHDHITEHHVHLRMLAKKIHHPRQAPGQILLIAIQIRDNFATGPAQSPINRIVHTLVFLNKRFDPLLFQ